MHAMLTAASVQIRLLETREALIVQAHRAPVAPAPAQAPLLRSASSCDGEAAAALRGAVGESSEGESLDAAGASLTPPPSGQGAERAPPTARRGTRSSQRTRSSLQHGDSSTYLRPPSALPHSDLPALPRVRGLQAPVWR